MTKRQYALFVTFGYVLSGFLAVDSLQDWRLTKQVLTARPVRALVARWRHHVHVSRTVQQDLPTVLWHAESAKMGEEP